MNLQKFSSIVNVAPEIDIVNKNFAYLFSNLKDNSNIANTNGFKHLGIQNIDRIQTFLPTLLKF